VYCHEKLDPFQSPRGTHEEALQPRQTRQGPTPQGVEADAWSPGEQSIPPHFPDAGEQGEIVRLIHELNEAREQQTATSRGRFDYAAIGTVSNVASRLCDKAKPGQTLISPRVLTKVENAVKNEGLDEFELKGSLRAVGRRCSTMPAEAEPKPDPASIDTKPNDIQVDGKRYTKVAGLTWVETTKPDSFADVSVGPTELQAKDFTYSLVAEAGPPNRTEAATTVCTATVRPSRSVRQLGDRALRVQRLVIAA
jgi:hypothetical protein